MDIIESMDALFENLYQSVLKANGDSNNILQCIKDAQYKVLYYTTIMNNNDIQRIKPRIVNKECIVV